MREIERKGHVREKAIERPGTREVEDVRYQRGEDQQIKERIERTVRKAERIEFDYRSDKRREHDHENLWVRLPSQDS